jgi:predicted transposase/invertase (TIGR01784 family)
VKTGSYFDEDNIMIIGERLKKEGFEQGIEKGIEQGMEKGILLIAKNMLAENISLDMVAKLTGIPIEQLKRFKH